MENAAEDLQDAVDDARNVLGHRTHKNEGLAGFAQDIYFFGGGEWDHKPVIRPIWHTDNRIGNKSEVYYYDTWSNLHFGFIGRTLNLALHVINAGAARAQNVDNATSSGDDPADAEAIAAGYALREAKSSVDRSDIINILERNPSWQKFVRF